LDSVHEFTDSKRENAETKGKLVNGNMLTVKKNGKKLGHFSHLGHANGILLRHSFWSNIRPSPHIHGEDLFKHYRYTDRSRLTNMNQPFL